MKKLLKIHRRRKISCRFSDRRTHRAAEEAVMARDVRRAVETDSARRAMEMVRDVHRAMETDRIVHRMVTVRDARRVM